MAHEKYSPVGYDYQGDHYCLDCIPQVAAGGIATRSSKAAGYKRDECNCAECRLDRMAAARNIDRYDESSYDMDDFPKAIPYFNDLHAECGPEGYGYGPDDPEWKLPYCNATCAKCHAVIDGTVLFNSDEVCPAWAHRKENES